MKKNLILNVSLFCSGLFLTSCLGTGLNPTSESHNESVVDPCAEGCGTADVRADWSSYSMLLYDCNGQPSLSQMTLTNHGQGTAKLGLITASSLFNSLGGSSPDDVISLVTASTCKTGLLLSPGANCTLSIDPLPACQNGGSGATTYGGFSIPYKDGTGAKTVSDSSADPGYLYFLCQEAGC